MNKLVEKILRDAPNIKKHLEEMPREELIEAYLTMQTVVAVLIKDQPILAGLFFTSNQSLIEPMTGVLEKFESVARIDWNNSNSLN